MIRGYIIYSRCDKSKLIEKESRGIGGRISTKRNYMFLSILPNEQENTIEKYLNRGTMFALVDDEVKAECVVTDEDGRILEFKNIAPIPDSQRRGFSRALLHFLENWYKNRYRILQIGTGDSPLIIIFYQKCGFVDSYKVKSFFVDNYDHPIIECDDQLVDMVYLQKSLE